MKRVGAVDRMAFGALLAAALLALLLPAAAEAQSAAGSQPAEAPAGITVTGIGFAPTKAFAADHAVRDARQRAASIAAVLRLDLGGAESVYMPELTQFARSPRLCGPKESRPADCRTAATATVTFGVVGGATDAEVVRTVSASGAASVPVEPRDRTSDRWIKHAIATARRAATQGAAVAALRNVKIAADAAGLQLGPLVSVVEAAPASFPLPPFYVPSFHDPLLGIWGPGVFCRTTRRPVVRRDPDTGRPEIVRRASRRRCSVPSTYETQLEVRYSAG